MTFEPRHDAVRLGKLTALDDDGQPIALASLADLVYFTMGGNSASGLPLKAAAAAVLDKIQSAGPLPVIYATYPSIFASVVLPDHVFRKGQSATQQHVRLKPPHSHTRGGWQVQPNAAAGWREKVVPAHSAVKEIRGPAGCLEWLREVWTKNPKGEALLDIPRCARFAMRLDLAQALFDFGPGLKDAEPMAHLVTAADTVTAPAAGTACQTLAGLPKHDAKRWGAPHSAELRPRKLVRLADVVRMICERCGVESPQYCAGLLLEKLGERNPPPLFQLQPGPLALPFADDHLWRERFASGADTLAKHHHGNLTSCFFLMNPCLQIGEAKARGLNQDPGLLFYGISDSDIELWPELPELRGPAGALELMRQQWGQRAQTFDDLDTDPLATVAILEADAVGLAGLLFGTPTLASAARSASVTDQPAIDNRVPGLWPHQPGAAWSDDERVALFKMRHIERMTDRAIAARVGCERSRVGQVIGSKDAWKNKDGYKGEPWQPSGQLLAECSLKPLQPLQLVALALT